MYRLRFYGISKSHAKTDALYRNADNQFRTCLWNHIGVLYTWRKRKNEL